VPTREKESSKQQQSVDVGVVKAIGHPLRMQLLARLNERVASPVELARELDESVQLVSYHVRILRDLGFVELVSTTPRRGAIEHHYRATRRPYFSDEDFAALPANARAAISGTTLEGLMQHAAGAHRAGAFEQKDNVHVSTTDLLLDDEAFAELAGMMTDVLDRALELQTESRARLQDGATESRAHLSMLLYPSDGATPDTARGRRHSPKRSRKKS
jgi:DNA-binding transcriptional ArsR family regulator